MATYLAKEFFLNNVCKIFFNKVFDNKNIMYVSLGSGRGVYEKELKDNGYNIITIDNKSDRHFSLNRSDVNPDFTSVDDFIKAHPSRPIILLLIWPTSGDPKVTYHEDLEKLRSRIIFMVYLGSTIDRRFMNITFREEDVEDRTIVHMYGERNLPKLLPKELQDKIDTLNQSKFWKTKRGRKRINRKIKRIRTWYQSHKHELIDKPEDEDGDEDEAPISGSVVLSNYLKKHFDVKIALKIKLLHALSIDEDNLLTLYEFVCLPSRKNEYLIYFILQGKN